MTDEAPHTEDTPGSTEADTDWQTRYQSLQPEYTRATQALKDRESAWENDQAVLGRLQELRPDLFEDDEDEETPASDDFEDPREAKIAQLEERLQKLEPWQQDVENERGEQRFKRDLKVELGDETVPEKVNDWIKSRTAVLGNNAKALKQAVEEYREFTKELAGQHLDQVTKSKKAPNAPPTGQAGTQVPNLDNRREREAYLRQRAAEMEAASQR